VTTTRSDFARTLDHISRGKYVSVTTYRRDGRAVPTPVGALAHEGVLYALTAPDSGKVKRIRTTPASRSPRAR
jgi:PPOX class probable F420-dependent enzyme